MARELPALRASVRTRTMEACREKAPNGMTPRLQPLLMPTKSRSKLRAIPSSATRLDKVLYSASKFAKGEVIEYYIRVAP